MPFEPPAEWASVVEKAAADVESATESAARRAPFPVIRVALTLVLSALFISIFPAATQGNNSIHYFVVSGNIETQLAAVPRTWLDASATPVDDISAEWAAIAVLLLTTVIVALFVVASFALLTTVVLQMCVRN